MSFFRLLADFKLRPISSKNFRSLMENQSSNKNYWLTLFIDRAGNTYFCLESTVTIWIPNTWIRDSKGVQYSNEKITWIGRPFKYRTFWATNRPFSVRFSYHHLNTGPIDNQTQIYNLNTKLVRYSDGYFTLNPRYRMFHRQDANKV